MLAITAIVAFVMLSCVFASKSKVATEDGFSKSKFQLFSGKKSLLGKVLSPSLYSKMTKLMTLAQHHEYMTTSRASELIARHHDAAAGQEPQLAAAKVGTMRNGGYLNVATYTGSNDCSTGLSSSVSVQMGVCHKVCSEDGDGACGTNPNGSYIVVGGDPQGKKAAYLLFSVVDTCDVSFETNAGAARKLIGGPEGLVTFAFDQDFCIDEGEGSVHFTVTSTPQLNLPGDWVLEKGYTTAAACTGSNKADSGFPTYVIATPAATCVGGLATDHTDQGINGIQTTCSGTTATRSYFTDNSCSTASTDISATTFGYDDLCANPSYFDLGFYFTNYAHKSIVCATDFVSAKAGPKGAKTKVAKKATKALRA